MSIRTMIPGQDPGFVRARAFAPLVRIEPGAGGLDEASNWSGWFRS